MFMCFFLIYKTKNFWNLFFWKPFIFVIILKMEVNNGKESANMKKNWKNNVIKSKEIIVKES